MEKHEEDEASADKPTPDDFDNYLPWACNQLQLDTTIFISKVFQNEYVGVGLTDRSKKGKSRIKLTQSRYDINSDTEKEDKSTSGLPQLIADPKIVRITTIYDSYNNLIELRFERNRLIPRLLLKIIGLILQFHYNLNSIVINGGLDKYTIYEVNKFLVIANITEICLDNSYLKEANYHILLETGKTLRTVSLSRCKINDQVVQNISKRLIYPSPASKTLIVLNLSTNRITDIGAKYISEALRTNRKLSYLNLADNRLTDDGASFLLDSLGKFSLTCEELLAARSRHMLYLKEKSDLIERMVKELRASEFDRKAAKRKSIKPVAPSSGKKGKLDRESSLKSLMDPNAKSLVNMDIIFYEKAVTMADNAIGAFNDPHSTSNTTAKDGVVYCNGNNMLHYLNLAYNNLTYLSLRKILNVLQYQKFLDRKPRGLINVQIEGNPLPAHCKELAQIDDIIETGLMAHNRRLSGSKKKAQSKTTSRV